jgi:hypothetical protein
MLQFPWQSDGPWSRQGLCTNFEAMQRWERFGSFNLLVLAGQVLGNNDFLYTIHSIKTVLVFCLALCPLGPIPALSSL